MSVHPSGAVTFLFTDIEGSTRLWQRHPQAMKVALADHDRIVRSIVEGHSGYVFTTGGDSFSVAFSEPLEAALAALDLQRAIDAHDWSDVEDLRVRAVLDTGVADERDGDYFGPPLNRAALILKQTDGGEILCSHTTFDLIKHDLPPSYTATRAGRRHVRDADTVETLYRLAPATEEQQRTRWIATASVVATVTMIGVGWSLTREPKVDPSTTTTDTTTTTSVTTTGQTPDGLLWREPIGELTTQPLIVGDLVVTATDDSVTGRDISTGAVEWEYDGLEHAHSLATDGDFIYVTSRERLDVLHPVTGELMPGCGFHLPVAFAMTDVAPHDVYVMTGALYRVTTEPLASRCHGPVVENAGEMASLGPIAGPIHGPEEVLAGDGIGVYAFDPATLELLWRYPDRAERTIAVHPAAFSVLNTGERVRTNYTPRSTIALADTDGILTILQAEGGSVAAAPIGTVRIDPDHSIVITRHAVVAVDRIGRLIGIDGDGGGGGPKWTLDEFEVAAGPVAMTPWIVVATRDRRIIAVDPIDGSIAHPTELPVAPDAIATQGEIAVLVDGETLQAVSIPWATSSQAWRPPQLPSASPEPEKIARDFIAAWNRGDRESVEELVGVDLSYLVFGLGDTWSNGAREIFWNWFNEHQVMDGVWLLGECTTGESSRTLAEVACVSTYSDLVIAATGEPLEEFQTKFTITNGSITKVVGGSNISRPGYGGVYTDLGGYWVIHDGFAAWARDRYGDEYDSLCPVGSATTTVACRSFIEAHIDEWAADSGS